MPPDPRQLLIVAAFAGSIWPSLRGHRYVHLIPQPRAQSGDAFFFRPLGKPVDHLAEAIDFPSHFVECAFLLLQLRRRFVAHGRPRLSLTFSSPSANSTPAASKICSSFSMSMSHGRRSWRSNAATVRVFTFNRTAMSIFDHLSSLRAAFAWEGVITWRPDSSRTGQTASTVGSPSCSPRSSR
jgi:hypothetical protein